MKTQFLTEKQRFSARPVIIDRVSEDLLYLGYCVDSCSAFDEDKWLIQMWRRTESIEQIGYPNGIREYIHKWTDRAKLEYRLAPLCPMIGFSFGGDFNFDFSLDFKI